MADILDHKEVWKYFLITNTFECNKKPNVKILAFPLDLQTSCPSHHFQAFSPFKNPASFQSISAINKDKLAESDKYQRKN